MDDAKVLADAKSELARLRTRVEKLEALITLLDNSGPVDLIPPYGIVGPDSPFPSPRVAMLDAIKTMPNRPVKPRHVFAVVERNGAFDPRHKSGKTTYGTALRRLADEPDSGVSLNPETGQYTYVPPIAFR